MRAASDEWMLFVSIGNEIELQQHIHHPRAHGVWSPFIIRITFICAFWMCFEQFDAGLLEHKNSCADFWTYSKRMGGIVCRRTHRGRANRMCYQLYKAPNELAAAANNNKNARSDGFQQVIRSNGLMALLAYRISCSAVGISISPLHRTNSLSTIWSLKDSCQITATI